MTTMNAILFNEEDDLTGLDYFEDTARSIEIVREKTKDGHLGSFGFTLVHQRPPRVGTVVPGSPADKAGLKTGDFVLAVDGEDLTKKSHKDATAIIRNTNSPGVWLSVCESDESSSMNNSISSGSKMGFYASTPIIPTNPMTLNRPQNFQNGLNTSKHCYNSSMLTPSSYGTSPVKGGGLSPLGRKLMVPNDPNYVTLIPASSYTLTRMSILLTYCGPVKIPDSWSHRGVSSLCLQECARQLLSKRTNEDFLTVQLEVSQNSLRITNLSGNILVKHRRKELYYCGSCTNDEQYFGVVSKSSDTESTTRVLTDLCHIFKLLPESKLSTYCIDRSKSQREQRSGSPTPVKSSVDVTDTIQNIFKNEASLSRRPMELTSSGDGIEYGVVRGISTFQLAGGISSNGSSNESLGYGSSSIQNSPLLKRKKSNVIDLRSKVESSPRMGEHSRIRSTSNPVNPISLEQRTIHPFSTSSSALMFQPQEGIHIRMGSDGSNSSNHSVSSFRSGRQLLRTHPPRDDAKRISDCSISSMSSDHSGHRSLSGSPSSSPNKSLSPTPVPPVHHNDISPQHISKPRKFSNPRDGSISPTSNGMYGSKLQLRRQGSEGSIYDLTALQMSPYHHFGLPSKNSGLSTSVDSIVTITTLAEDDVDVVVGRVAGWCGSFDRLLSDPLGLQCFLHFLETQHGEENIMFWKDAEEFKKVPVSQLQQVATKIYEDYLNPSSPYCINIDDSVLKSVQANINNPTASLFAEAQKEIYQLMKLDCFPRFQKSQLIKDCLCAEMEGRSLPVQLSPLKHLPVKPGNVWGKKKPSLLSRIRGTHHKEHAVLSLVNPPPIQTLPSSKSSSAIEPKKSKKERKELKKHNKSKTPEVEYHPEDNLKHLQEHKGNIFEINLPNRITKIIEAPSHTSIRDALANVLKKYGYSLDVMDVKLTSTLQTVNVDSPAAILIGKHISLMRSKHTVTVHIPDLPEIILPADGTQTLRQLFDRCLVERQKIESYSVFLEGARAPLELDISTSILEGHSVQVHFIPGATTSTATISIPDKTQFSLSSESGSSIESSSSKLSEGVDELFSMIARLNSDTLQDQCMTQEEAKEQKKSTRFKKGKKAPSPKFTRTKSGAVISHTKLMEIPQQRSLSPPPNLTQSLPRAHYPPPPSSDPPTLTHHTLNKPYGREYGHHQHQRSSDAMSGISMGSGSSVDSITHEFAGDRMTRNRSQVKEWVNSQSSLTSSGGPQFFPTALDTLERSLPAAFPLNLRQSSSLTRHQGNAISGYLNRSQHPLDTLVNDTYNQKQSTWPQQGEHIGVSTGSVIAPPSNYPWRYAHGNQEVKPRSDQGSVTSDDGHHFSDSGSMVSNSSSTRGVSNRKPPLSPTTHVLIVEDQSHSSTETYV